MWPIASCRLSKSRWIGPVVGAVQGRRAGRYRGDMSELRDDSTAQLEDQLDGVSRTLSSMEELNARQAERVGARMDRLASQLLELSAPPAMDGVYQRFGVARATDEDFAALVDEMGSPGGDG